MAENIVFSGTRKSMSSESLCPPKPCKPKKIEEPIKFMKDILVCGCAKFKNKVHLESTLAVCGETKLGDKLEVQGDTKLNRDVAVHGNAAVRKELCVRGHTKLECELHVKGNAKLDSNLDVCGKLEVHQDAKFGKDVWIQDDLRVEDNTDLRGRLHVHGETKLESSLEVAGATQLNSHLQVLGDTRLEGNLHVEGKTYLSGGFYPRITRVENMCEYLIKHSDISVWASGKVVLVLPVPGESNLYQWVNLKNLNNDRAVTVRGIFDGVNVRILSPGSAIAVQSDGTKWVVVSDTLSMF